MKIGPDDLRDSFSDAVWMMILEHLHDEGLSRIEAIGVLQYHIHLLSYEIHELEKVTSTELRFIGKCPYAPSYWKGNEEEMPPAGQKSL